MYKWKDSGRILDLIDLLDYSTLISTPCLSGVNCVEVCYS